MTFKTIGRVLCAALLAACVSCVPCGDEFDFSRWSVMTSGDVTVNSAPVTCDMTTKVRLELTGAASVKATNQDNVPLGTMCGFSMTFRTSCAPASLVVCSLYDGDLLISSANSGAPSAALEVSGMSLSGKMRREIYVEHGGDASCAYAISNLRDDC